MSASSCHSAAEVLESLVGMECWYVNAGGAGGTTFSLAFGRRVKRRVPLANPEVAEEFRHNTGEANLYVWCSWRLENEHAALGSSEQEPGDAVEAIRRLQGQRLESLSMSGRAMDLVLRFAPCELRLFCDRVDGDPCMATNWELVVGDRELRAGPGYLFEESTLAPSSDEPDVDPTVC